ncbi:Hypothetical predicted protein [Mytilus galloprovincialis]|uniref:CCHC-type domain-containing protein n=1 Tax=Mytilus galloprovincialis TaxID=29158 RepID=A0A8B6F9G1_MYTGA|nr:Hypothetical predicted protein [Mytilus galloprovincialis]
MAEPHGNVHFNYFNIITPPMYNGSGNPSNWLLYFRKWIKINSILNENACHYLPFYLKESAKVWFDGLNENIQNSTENLEIGLVERFSRNEDDIELDVKQKENESVLEFFDRLRIIAKDLEIPENLEFIMDKKGLLPKLNTSIILSNPKNLNELKQAAIIAEKCANVRKTIKDSDCSNLNVIKQNKDLDEITEKIETLNSKIKEQMPQISEYRNNKVNIITKQNYVCKYCGMSYYHKNHKCKARNKECFNCKKVGHLARVCLTKSYRNVVKTKSFKSRQKPHKKKRENIYINLMTNIEGNNVNVDILGIKTKGLIDTGAAVSCISSSLFNKLDKTKIKSKLVKDKQCVWCRRRRNFCQRTSKKKLPLKFDKRASCLPEFLHN